MSLLLEEGEECTMFEFFSEETSPAHTPNLPFPKPWRNNVPIISSERPWPAAQGPLLDHRHHGGGAPGKDRLRPLDPGARCFGKGNFPTSLKNWLRLKDKIV